MKTWKEVLMTAPFVIAIAVLTNIFVYYGLHLVYPAPLWEDFCGDKERLQINDETTCLAEGGIWNPSLEVVSEGQTPVRTGYCEATYECRENYEEAQKSYNGIKLLVLLIAGSIVLALAITRKLQQAVTLGFSYGGAFLLLGALGSLWNIAADLGKLVVIGVLLVLLVFVTNRYFNHGRQDIQSPRDRE
jgi:uncharacterized protein (DUF983 family)